MRDVARSLLCELNARRSMRPRRQVVTEPSVAVGVLSGSLRATQRVGVQEGANKSWTICAHTSNFFFSAFSSKPLIWPSMRLLFDADTQGGVDCQLSRGMKNASIRTSRW